MKYSIFESGSKGNCTLIESEGRYLLIDAGISKKKLKAKLEQIGKTMEDINHVLITHNHSDHISGIDAFPKEMLYSTYEVLYSIYKVLYPTYATLPDIPLANQLIPYQTYRINGFDVLVIPTSHDTDGSVGFSIGDGKETLVYVTDTGYLYEKSVDLIGNADYYIFESNHNVKALIESDRPQSLKKRIMGDYGHLSNEDSANYLCDVVGEKTREIVLAHLSEEVNSPELALADLMKVFKKRGVDFDRFRIRCASQTETVSGGEDFVRI